MLTLSEPSDEMLRTIFKEVLSKVSTEKRGRGRPSYPVDAMTKLFILMFLRRVSSERGLVRYLKDHPEEAQRCGLESIPERRTIGRFRKRMGPSFFDGLFKKLREKLDQLLPYSTAIVDSTPIEKPDDPDARVGFYSKGSFKGFKVHVKACEEDLPRACVVTPGNRNDSPFLPSLIEDAKVVAVVADAEYDSEENHECVLRKGAIPFIARNKRNEKHGKFKKAV